MNDLTTLKLHLKVDPDLTVDDPLIVAMQEAAVAYLQNETGCYFGPVAEITEVVAAQGWGPVWLQAAPLPDSVETPFLLERRLSPVGEYSEVATTEYEIDGQRLHPLVYWAPGVRTLRVTYWAGYAEGAEPADVQQAARELVTKMYEVRLPAVVETTDTVAQVIRDHRIQVVG